MASRSYGEPPQVRAISRGYEAGASLVVACAARRTFSAGGSADEADANQKFTVALSE